VASRPGSLPVRKVRAKAARAAWAVPAKRVVLAVASRKVRSRGGSRVRPLPSTVRRRDVLRAWPARVARVRVVRVAQTVRRSAVRASLIRCKPRSVLPIPARAVLVAAVAAPVRCVPVASRAVAWMACRAAVQKVKNSLSCSANRGFAPAAQTLVTVVSRACAHARDCGEVNKRL
jgi:hypothetical protein